MRQLFNIDDSLSNKISYYHAILFFVFLPFDRFYSLVVLISFAAHTLLHFSERKTVVTFDMRLLILQSVYYIAFAGAIYSPVPDLALSELTKKLAIFLLPLIFYFNPIDLNKYREHLMLFFASSCTIAITYLFADALYIILYNRLPISALFSSLFINQNFSEPIMMHATFLSMYAALSLVYILTEMAKPLALVKRIIYSTAMIVLAAGLFQLCSKSVFIAMLLIINLAFPYFVLKGRHRIKFLAFSVAFSIMALAVIFTTETFRNRYISDLRFDLNDQSENRVTDSRMERWNVAIDLIKKRPLSGYGTGSEIPLLKEQYFEKKLYSAFIHGLNAHNQYLSLLLKTGFWGLSIYIYTLFFGFKQAIRSRDILFFSFMLLITTVSLSENFLEVNKGIFFYAAFFTLFTFSNTAKKR